MVVGWYKGNALGGKRLGPGNLQDTADRTAVQTTSQLNDHLECDNLADILFNQVEERAIPASNSSLLP